MTKYLNGQKINEMIVFSNNADRTISVSVSLDPFQEGSQKVRISQTEITRYLQDAGYDIDTCIKGAVITNTGDKLFGEWVYTLKQKSILDVVKDIVKDIPSEVFKDIPTDGAQNVDKYINDHSCQDHEKDKKPRKKKATNDPK